MSHTDEIRTELGRLRRGRGVYAANLWDRLGPNLRELAGVDGHDRLQTRWRLIEELETCAAQLTAELRAVILGALAISQETRHLRNLDGRVAALAERLNYGERTIRRRIDDTEVLLAEAIADRLRLLGIRTAIAPEGWDLDELRTMLFVDRPGPEAHEHRRIIATRDALREVVAWLDVPADGAVGLVPEMMYGGDLVRQVSPVRNRFHLMVRLPRALRIGESHEYGMIVRLADGQSMRPHYIFTPECRCRVFKLRVRFDRARPPAWVRRVEGEPVRLFDAAEPGADLLTIDDAGEIGLEFRSPAMYLGYGVQWRP